MTMAQDVAPATIPPRRIRTRRIEFDYPVDELPRHFVSGDPVMSSVVAVLSSLFPEGEDFFVRSVRNYRDRISDPELKKQVGGFIGQESIHGREHREFNERLQSLGYPTRFIDRGTKYGLGALARILPKNRQLAITAALEHYTATLAETLLSDPEARDLLSVPEVQSLFLWHAVEESEHKSVAFDVYEAVCGSHWIRTMVMNGTTVVFLAVVVGGTTLSLLLNGHTYRHPVRTLRNVARLRSSPWLGRDVIRRLRDYNRRGFHPDDHDATALLEEWRAKLFGDSGTLADRLKAG
ncbi:MAG: metal-dependent hydrolase [Acidimicrobiales bacterium]